MRFPRMVPGDLLVVKLYDIHHCYDWIPDEQAQTFPFMLCGMVGWFVNKDRDVIRISSKVCGDGDKTVTVIPRGCIKSIQVVEYDRG